MVDAKSKVVINKAVQLADDRLKQRRYRDRVIDPCRDVAYAELKGREFVMRPHIPPDLRPILNAVHMDQKVEIGLVLCVGFKMIGHFRSWEFLEDFRSVRLKPGVKAQPERRRRRQCQHVRQKIPSGVHYLYSAFEIGYADVHMHTKDQ